MKRRKCPYSRVFTGIIQESQKHSAAVCGGCRGTQEGLQDGPGCPGGLPTPSSTRVQTRPTSMPQSYCHCLSKGRKVFSRVKGPPISRNLVPHDHTAAHLLWSWGMRNRRWGRLWFECGPQKFNPWSPVLTVLRKSHSLGWEKIPRMRGSPTGGRQSLRQESRG